MSLIKKLLVEQEDDDRFRLSYKVPYNRIPFLIRKIEENVPTIEVHEEDNGDVIAFFSDTEEMLFRYDYSNNILHSDHTFVNLLSYGKE